MFIQLLDPLIWSASLLNAVLMGIQLLKLIKTRDSKGLSIIMLCGFVYMQTIYAAYGWASGQIAMLWGMGASALITTAIVVLARKFRR